MLAVLYVLDSDTYQTSGKKKEWLCRKQYSVLELDNKRTEHYKMSYRK